MTPCKKGVFRVKSGSQNHVQDADINQTFLRGVQQNYVEENQVQHNKTCEIAFFLYTDYHKNKKNHFHEDLMAGFICAFLIENASRKAAVLIQFIIGKFQHCFTDSRTVGFF